MSRSAKANKKFTRHSFVVSTGQFRKEILVTTGYSAKEIISYLKKIKARKELVEWALSCEKRWQETIDKNCAFFTIEPDRGSMMLRLRPFEDSWEFWETLIHELSHLSDAISERMSFTGETESKAYLVEWLFRSIRRHLQQTENNAPR